jgi:hypothetical protein
MDAIMWVWAPQTTTYHCFPPASRGVDLEQCSGAVSPIATCNSCVVPRVVVVSLGALHTI